jgi:hypothetical protein
LAKVSIQSAAACTSTHWHGGTKAPYQRPYNAVKSLSHLVSNRRMVRSKSAHPECKPDVRTNLTKPDIGRGPWRSDIHRVLGQPRGKRLIFGVPCRLTSIRRKPFASAAFRLRHLRHCRQLSGIWRQELNAQCKPGITPAVSQNVHACKPRLTRLQVRITGCWLASRKYV